MIDSRKLTWNSAVTMFGVPLALLGAPGTEQFSAFGQAKKLFTELTLHPRYWTTSPRR